MQAQLIGHVPPTSGNYFSACYSRYTDIVLRYQDTVVGQHFGHMNIDAWFLQEDDWLVDTTNKGSSAVQPKRYHSNALAGDLRKDYDLVPTRQKANPAAYLPFFVAPSVVPCVVYVGKAVRRRLTFSPKQDVLTECSSLDLQRKSSYQPHRCCGIARRSWSR